MRRITPKGRGTRRRVKVKKEAWQKIRRKPKPVRDKKHPLRVLSICYGGERSGEVLDKIYTPLKEMGYLKFFEIKSAGESRVSQQMINKADILIFMKGGIPKRVAPMIEKHRHKIIEWQYNYDFVRGPGEEIVNKILRQAEKFLELRF